MLHENFNNIDEEYFTSIIDEDITFNGNIVFEEATIIKGYIKGKVESKNNLIIGPNAIIDADISAKSLECFGKINGDIDIEEEAYFHFPAILNGDVKTTLLTFEKGCIINGTIKMPKEIKHNEQKLTN